MVAEGLNFEFQKLNNLNNLIYYLCVVLLANLHGTFVINRCIGTQRPSSSSLTVLLYGNHQQYLFINP